MKLSNRYNFSIHSVSNFFIIFIFVLLLPMQEWPDTNNIWLSNENFETEAQLADQYISYANETKEKDTRIIGHFRFNSYSNILNNILNFFNIPEPVFINSELPSSFFSDSYLFDLDYKNISVNILKLIFILPLFYITNKICLNLTSYPLVFAPPYIFSLLAVTLEPFAIIFLTLSYLLCISNFYFTGIIIGVLATAIDRSMVPSFFSIIILTLYLKSFEWKKNYSFYLLLLFFFLIILISINFFFTLTLDLYGITFADLVYNRNFGKNNFLALFTSLSGLYGWMNIRPFYWPLYYSIISILFIYGFYKCDRHKKLIFSIFLFFAIITLQIIPSLSQARYYPILTLLYWESVLIGAKHIFGRVDIFILIIVAMTALGFLTTQYL